MTTDIEKREQQEVGSTAAEQLRHSGPAYSPDVDIYVSENEALFIVDLPGVNKGDVTIEVDESDSLIIRGVNGTSEPENAVVKQYRTGNYYRAFQLSKEYDKDKISAKLEYGLLEVSVPRREEAKPKRIEIKA
ncbi:MAG: Hsp20/alpha crystallin family protein [Chitinispirillaceae bacterium]|nr:Hsp20/alpha crystallin family protein [Chitinispirillaceae bacterium]